MKTVLINVVLNMEGHSVCTCTSRVKNTLLKCYVNHIATGRSNTPASSYFLLVGQFCNQSMQSGIQQSCEPSTSYEVRQAVARSVVVVI